MAETAEPQQRAPRSAPGCTARVAPWSRFEEVALDSRVRRRLFTGKRAMVVHCELLPGAVIPLHAHKVEQFTTCLKGRIEVHFDQRTVFLAPGRAVRIPATVPHTLRVLDPGGAETLNVFEPEDSGGQADL
jgi:quercetin dioxygenase-like cupin family protein